MRSTNLAADFCAMRHRSSRANGPIVTPPAGESPRVRVAGPGLQVISRRCTICEWEAQLIEDAAEDDRLCPWCYGPTERAAVLGRVVPEQLSPGEKNPSARSLGRLGGLKGGHARAASLTAKQRHDIAAKAARARWGKKR
jgi:hypothetical protein